MMMVKDRAPTSIHTQTHAHTQEIMDKLTDVNTDSSDGEKCIEKDMNEHTTMTDPYRHKQLKETN